MNKDTGIILGVCVLVFLVGGILYLGSGRSTETPGGTEEVSFSVLSAGAAAADMREKKNYRIVDEAQLAMIWALAHGDEAPPVVDFTSNEVLAVFDGEHTTGGYEISVERILDQEDVREVRIVHAAPDASCVVTQAVTSPFQIVIVPKTDRDIDREDLSATVACE